MAGVRQKLFEALRRCNNAVAVNGFGQESGLTPQQARQAGVDEHVLSCVIAEALGVEYLEGLNAHDADEQFVAMVPIAFARQHRILGLISENGQVPVAIGSIESLDQLENVGRFLGYPVQAVFADPEQIEAAINTAYGDQV